MGAESDGDYSEERGVDLVDASTSSAESVREFEESVVDAVVGWRSVGVGKVLDLILEPNRLGLSSEILHTCTNLEHEVK